MSVSHPESSSLAAPAPTDFLSNILTPGSSLHPTFQLILDGAFAMLLMVLVTLVIMTRGNLHLVALIGIELCLWASVKWYVHELQKVPAAGPASPEDDVKEKKE